jgi:PhoPQ-activated pathogenicity-related protein
MIARSAFLRASTAVAAATVWPSHLRAQSGPTALDRYVAAPAPEYRFDVVDSSQGDGYRQHVVSMVSQRWRTNAEVDEPRWTHWLTIVEPERIATRIGTLVIGGGSRGDAPPRRLDPAIAGIAVRTGSLLAELHGVPNQPLTFAGDAHPRAEDDLIAYSWDRFLHTGDETWPLRLPMTKAVVRAMDTIATLSARARHDPVVDRFIVGGASKRGWTAWTTAAVDRRVVALVPVVIDVLNVEASAEHAYRAYGRWPQAFAPYEKLGIMSWLGTPQLEALLRIEDPYTYRDRLTVPKLIVNATGDQFFAPDSSQFYFGALPGENHLRYLPNTDHSLRGIASDAAQTAVAFIDAIVARRSLPRFTWRADEDGTIRVQTATRPESVRLWRAVNPHARDFRLQTIGPAFHPAELRERKDGTYVANGSPPRHGFEASFVELRFRTHDDEPFTVTTGVRISPDVLPFPPPRSG